MGSFDHGPPTEQHHEGICRCCLFHHRPGCPWGPGSLHSLCQRPHPRCPCGSRSSRRPCGPPRCPSCCPCCPPCCSPRSSCGSPRCPPRRPRGPPRCPPCCCSPRCCARPCPPRLPCPQT